MTTAKLVPQVAGGIAALLLVVAASAPASAMLKCSLNSEARGVPLYDNPGGALVRNVDVAADWTSEQGIFSDNKAGGDAGASTLWVRVKDSQGAMIGYLSVVEGGVTCSGGF